MLVPYHIHPEMDTKDSPSHKISTEKNGTDIQESSDDCKHYENLKP